MGNDSPAFLAFQSQIRDFLTRPRFVNGNYRRQKIDLNVACRLSERLPIKNEKFSIIVERRALCDVILLGRRSTGSSASLSRPPKFVLYVDSISDV